MSNEEHIEEHIENLILKEFAGMITSAEQRELDILISEDPKVKALRSEIRIQLSDPRLARNIRELKQFSISDVVTSEKIRKRKVLNTIAAVAAVVVVVFVTYILRKEPAKTLPYTHKTIAQLAGIKNIQLNVDGKIVDLSNPVQMTTQQAEITSNNDTLSYVSKGSHHSTAWATLTVPAGKDYNVKLSDGTEIYLNSATTFEFPALPTGAERRVRIRGEAYLKVAKKSSSPFIVELNNNVSVTVLGTEFNINTYDSLKTKVSLVNGAVRISDGQDSAKLSPGFAAVYGPQQGLNVTRFDSTEVTGWRKGIFKFKNVPLSEVLNTITRVHDVKFSIDDPAAGRRKITCILNKHLPLKEFLEGLEYTLSIPNYERGGVIHIGKAPE